ncbi:MAG: FAD-dependent oxidoreductase [Gemmatimonadota bacterium]|nr:FAD-dependent oxidoreductase [Gemmatimonadota bacterium]
MRTYDYVIIGGGLAAASAVDGIREVDAEGSIAVFSDEPDPPYHRPPLSKEYLQAPQASRELLYVKPSDWFEEQSGLTLFTETPVEKLDAGELLVHPADGDPVRAGRILLATGGRPRTLAIPGSDLKGVFTLRTAADAEAIREAAGEAGRALLVGGGFIGMELASTLRKLEIDPLVVEIEDRVWSKVFPEAVSGFLQGYFEERGVPFLLGSAVREFEGEDRLESAVMDDGEEVAIEVAVVGVGIDPAVELAADAGLGVQDGVAVDAYGETTTAHVYATGDIAQYPDPVFGDRARTEHWDHAKAHGRLVGRNMAGARDPYEHLSYYFTHVFDLSINVIGRTAGADDVVVSGELGSGRSIVYCATDDRLSGIIMINANDALDRCRELVRARPRMPDLLETLESPDTELGELVG